MAYYAHTPPDHDPNRWHLLVDHLRGTAELARSFARSFGGQSNAELAAEIAYRLALWHDLGKYSDGFQAYLKQCNDLHQHGRKNSQRGPDHKAAGMYLASELFGEHLALIIKAHHGGLEEFAADKDWLAKKEATDLATIKHSLQRARSELSALEPNEEVYPPDYLDSFDAENPDQTSLASSYSMEFFIRMIYSCLVDGDSLDTERHSDPAQANSRYQRNNLTDEHWQAFVQHHARLDKRGSLELLAAQDEIYEACLTAADQPPGFFRLTVPTGGGKTLSGLAFAIRHALKHKLERVIVAVPYLSITQQTTDTYRQVFAGLHNEDGNPVVLEHYSSSDAFKEEPKKEEHDEVGEFDPHKVWLRLAAENWDAPVVVTTTVQLFESMFARRRNPNRKLHNLANSVIILDETQSLPFGLLDPILSGLHELVEHYGSTVVFSTATQPTFDQVGKAAEPLIIREIVENYADHFNTLRRVEYRWHANEQWEWDDVAGRMVTQPEQQALAIVNTKRDAQALLDAVQLAGAVKEDIFHLSTLLCGIHRQKVLAEVRDRLDHGQHCLLVSTQVVEAGVDLDFPLVLRAVGPLDSIVQAAGRCNRRGKLNERGLLGQVIIFRPREGGEPLGLPKLARKVTESLWRGGNLNPAEPSVFADYYTRLFSVLGEAGTDSKKVQEVRQVFNYREVDRRFRMIDEDSVNLIVNYPIGNDAQAVTERLKVSGWVQELRDRRGSGRQLLRQLQPYMVALRRDQALALQSRISKGQPVIELIGEPDESDIGVWQGEYDELAGLVLPSGYGLAENVV